MGGSTVWLVGMMGAGKSAVGRALAARRGAPFVDSDAWVEERAGARVAEIFEREGEAGFRRREREALEACAGRPGVVALGGGAIAQPGAAELLRESRPLLAGRDAQGRLERLAELLAEREIHYGRAHVTIDTDALDVAAVCEAVEAALAGEGSP